MSEADATIHNISDTARWAAVYRARENERQDGAFRDPYARRLAGERGEAIASSMPFSEEATWAWIARTYLYDQFITERIGAGADLVVNLAAGLDARPYRMDLPPLLRWIEVDLPGILDYKEGILAGEKPKCALERARLDLSDVTARRELFGLLGSQSSNALIITEGLLIYFTPDEVAELAKDLAAAAGFRHWVMDIASPGLRRILERHIGPFVGAGDTRLQFAPVEGPPFFEPYGWKPEEVRGMLKTAARLGRLKFGFRLLALLPESKGKQGNRPWSAVCMLARQ
jgi:methyltransferase (TIGR00027 family)